MNTSNNTQTIEEFADWLIQQAGLQTMGEEALLVYRNKLSDQIARRLGLLMMAELSGNDADQFRAQFIDVDQPNTAAMQAFLSSRIENISQKTAAGLEQFAKEFLTAVQQANVLQNKTV
ncbi:MAG: hypothetical protein HYV33_01645 [Candidatus Kerfeldbacteria bacterium]|nr:hypothetical protein [Candidatus Kerfeldbacteria bacterium]